MYVYVCVCMCVYVYVHCVREREGERHEILNKPNLQDDQVRVVTRGCTWVRKRRKRKLKSTK